MNQPLNRAFTMDQKWAIAQYAAAHGDEAAAGVFEIAEARARRIRLAFGHRHRRQLPSSSTIASKISDARRLKIAQFSKIYTSAATAEEFGIAASTVRKIRMEFGLIKKKPGPCKLA
jgi:hypothetical protein